MLPDDTQQAETKKKIRRLHQDEKMVEPLDSTHICIHPVLPTVPTAEHVFERLSAHPHAEEPIVERKLLAGGEDLGTTEE